MAPVGPPAISNLIAWERSAHKHLELFAPDRAARGLVRALERGRFVGLLPDIPEGGPTVEVWFCNGPVRFSTVPAWLARLTGSPLLPVTCWRTGYASFRLQVHEPVPVTAGEDLHAITSRLASVFEPIVLRYPEQWYPFHRVYADEGDGRS
jgi:KDO2-lipid IV(A) lauroyltransferase